MACHTNNTPIDNNENINAIYSLLKRIDGLQKDVILNNLRNVCENCSLGSLNNTKPISIYGQCGIFSATIDAANTTSTTLFRVEEVNDETVVLRLLQNTDGTITCTNMTIVYNIGCICCVQCFESINCERCTN
jgi:hypothetical protein